MFTKNINFPCRLVTTEDGKFKFDIYYCDSLVLTDNKEYSSIDDCIDAFSATLKALCNKKALDPIQIVI